MATNPVAKNLSNVNQEVVACASGLLAHEPVLERSKAPTMLRSCFQAQGVTGVAHITWACQFSHVTVGRHSSRVSFQDQPRTCRGSYSKRTRHCNSGGSGTNSSLLANILSNRVCIDQSGRI